MGNQKIISDIKKGLQEKATDELLLVWKENKRTRWSDDAFEAIRQILKERSVEPPEQDVPTTFAPEPPEKIKDLKMPLWLTAVCIIVPALIIAFLGMWMVLKLF